MPRSSYVKRNYVGGPSRGQPEDRIGSKAENATRSELPDTNCFRCGARGWCEHRSAG